MSLAGYLSARVPAGFTRMPAAPSLALSALGTVPWTFVLAYASRLLGSQFRRVEQWIGPVSSGICPPSRILAARRREHAPREAGEPDAGR